MTVYRVTLVLAVPDEDGDPAKWDWTALTDHSMPVMVERSEAVGDNETEEDDAA